VKDRIRAQALRTCESYANLADFEAAMIAFGESLPPISSPTAKDPHHMYLCRGAARWVWEIRERERPNG